MGSALSHSNEELRKAEMLQQKPGGQQVKLSVIDDEFIKTKGIQNLSDMRSISCIENIPKAFKSTLDNSDAAFIFIRNNEEFSEDEFGSVLQLLTHVNAVVPSIKQNVSTITSDLLQLSSHPVSTACAKIKSIQQSPTLEPIPNVMRSSLCDVNIRRDPCTEKQVTPYALTEAQTFATNFICENNIDEELEINTPTKKIHCSRIQPHMSTPICLSSTTDTPLVGSLLRHSPSSTLKSSSSQPSSHLENHRENNFSPCCPPPESPAISQEVNSSRQNHVDSSTRSSHNNISLNSRIPKTGESQLVEGQAAPKTCTTSPGICCSSEIRLKQPIAFKEPTRIRDELVASIPNQDVIKQCPTSPACHLSIPEEQLLSYNLRSPQQLFPNTLKGKSSDESSDVEIVGCFISKPQSKWRTRHRQKKRILSLKLFPNNIVNQQTSNRSLDNTVADSSVQRSSRGKLASSQLSATAKSPRDSKVVIQSAKNWMSNSAQFKLSSASESKGIIIQQESSINQLTDNATYRLPELTKVERLIQQPPLSPTVPVRLPPHSFYNKHLVGSRSMVSFTPLQTNLLRRRCASQQMRDIPNHTSRSSPLDSSATNSVVVRNNCIYSDPTFLPPKKFLSATCRACPISSISTDYYSCPQKEQDARTHQHVHYNGQNWFCSPYLTPTTTMPGSICSVQRLNASLQQYQAVAEKSDVRSPSHFVLPPKLPRNGMPIVPQAGGNVLKCQTWNRRTLLTKQRLKYCRAKYDSWNAENYLFAPP